MFNIPLLEWVGYVGSVVVAVSLTMSSIKKLRWYNLAGAAVFSFYGFSIGALPVGFLNLFISLADIYYLYKIYGQKESFKSIVVDVRDPYLEYFLDFYQSEIKEFFPAFGKTMLKNETESKNTFAMLLLRNAVVAGVFFGVKNDQQLTVLVDFVTAQYRDLKPGDFIYQQNINQLKDQGISQIICQTENATHQKYLKKMGFEHQANNNIFSKNI